jgi:hypothetical protein
VRSEPCKQPTLNKKLTVPERPPESPDEMLEAWHQVYEGLTDEEIRQIEALALDRRHFMWQAP